MGRNFEGKGGEIPMKLTCVTATWNVIKAGNRERLIRCVKSVAALKTEHEHLIYDGASTDGTVELLKELAKTTPGVRIVSEKDTGIYNALNKGLRDASGDWFYVLGCDDCICNPEILDMYLTEPPQSVDMIVAKVFVEWKCVRSVGGFYRRNILFGTPYCHQGVIMRTSLVRRYHGFDERYKIFADYNLIVSCHLDAVKIAYKHEPFAMFTRGGFSLSGGGGPFSTETMDISKRVVGLTNDDLAVFQKRIYYPILKVLPFLFHRDSTLRLGAVYMLARNILWHLGFLRKKIQ